jgi:hypothetical protein
MSNLITTFSQMQQIIPTIVGNGDFDLYKTYRNDAETWLVNDIIGEELFTDIQESHNGSSGVAEKWAKALLLCRNIVALKAYHIAIPFLDLVQTANGFAVTMNANQAPASKDRVKALRNGVLERLNDAIEYLLKFLDDNIITFGAWLDAPSYTQRHNLLLQSARDFQKYLNINTSHRLYLAMVPMIQYVEDMHINSTLSKDLMDQIKAEIMEEELSEPNALILPDLKNAVANFTMSVAIDRMAVQVDPDGIKLSYTIGETSYSDVNRNKVLADKYEQQGMFYLRKVLQYILGHLTSFSAYTESDIYIDQTTGYLGYSNTETDSTFVAGV